MKHKRLNAREKLLMAANLASDPILPNQLFESEAASSVQGERKLMAAVLLDAVRTYAEQQGSSTPQGAKLFRETQEWAFKDDFDWLYSFRSICLALDIDPDMLRKRLVGFASRGVPTNVQDLLQGGKEELEVQASEILPGTR